MKICKVENRMVVDPQWDWNAPTEVRERLNGPGYKKMGASIFVPEEYAFDYALEHCFEVVPEFVRSLKWTHEFKEMLVKWFYSGNWVKEE